MEQISEKIKPIYDAVIELLNDGMTLPEIKVSDISKKAGIGKGTVYEYFTSKDEVISQALIYYVSVKLEDLEGVLAGKPTFREKCEEIMVWLDEGEIMESVVVSIFKLTHDSQDIMYNMKQEMMEQIRRWEGVDRFLRSLMDALRQDAAVPDSVEDFKLYFAICSQFGIYMLSSKCSSPLLNRGREALKGLIYDNIIKLVS